MSESSEFASHVVDLLEPFGRCEARRMFGGFGIFHLDLMFGLVADGNLYLKADDDNRADFELEGSDAFTYYRQGKPCRLSYYQAPEFLFEEPSSCLAWAESAFAAALRQQSGKRKTKS